MTPDLVFLLLALGAAGLAAGFVGGLFGIGGGVVVVPALYLLFTALEVDVDVRMHIAVGTALSTIISTSWRSLASHTKVGAVDYDILRAWTPWIALGAAAGAVLAGFANTSAMLFVFGGGLLLIALLLGFGNPLWRIADVMPTGAARAGIGGGIGLLSAMMGIGGGAFGVTLMTLCGRPIHHAVATAAGFGAAIALPATLGYMIAGWGRDGLPPWSLGYVSLPGFVIVGALTAITAPAGARLAHRLPQLMLKRAFAMFLGLISLSMLYEALS